MQNADAELYRRQKDAEAQQYEAEKEAAAIRAKGLAEAEAIRQKGLAEAEALDKKAEAMKKYGQAAILEMIVGVLPDIAKSVAEPLSAIDKVTVIGGNSDGVSDLAGNVPIIMGKVMESVKEATGIDMNEIIRAETFEGKTTKNINFTGLDQVGEEMHKVLLNPYLRHCRRRNRHKDTRALDNRKERALNVQSLFNFRKRYAEQQSVISLMQCKI